MQQNILELFAKRHSFYELNNNMPLSDEEIKHLIQKNLQLYPSPFNSQSTRIVLLLKDKHLKLWGIVLQKLSALTPENRISTLSEKISKFSQAYGTILFYIDKNVVQSLQDRFPLYAENFSNWSYQASAILQFMIWTSLADNSIGANLQHYNPVIDNEVKVAFDVPDSWELVAQMPFGGISQTPLPHSFENIEQKLIIRD